MKHNFGAGPCILPQEVFQEASRSVVDFNGLSILEVSHRHKDFVAVMDEATDLVKKALNVPEGYSVIFLQGGASLGFLISALNMMRDTKKASYINTGTWSKKAMTEAKKAGFELVEASEINANPLDSANHPKGVWTLPPRLALGEEKAEQYKAIGESDRMTLKFKKL